MNKENDEKMKKLDACILIEITLELFSKCTERWKSNQKNPFHIKAAVVNGGLL